MRWRSLAAVSLLVLALVACAHQPPPTGGAPLPGFFLGLLHGYISLFSLIASLFVDVRIYEYPNNGFFYDLGFIIGVLAFYGSGSKTYYYTYSSRRG
jgi:hydrogenase/urease accessory protein HupE